MIAKGKYFKFKIDPTITTIKTDTIIILKNQLRPDRTLFIQVIVDIYSESFIPISLQKIRYPNTVHTLCQ